MTMSTAAAIYSAPMFKRFRHAEFWDLFQSTDDAEPTGRLLPDHIRDKYEEWAEPGTIKGRPALLYYMVPNDAIDECVEQSGGDLGELNWKEYFDGIEFVD